MAPARTGNDKSRSKAVNRTLQTYRGINSIDNPSPRMFMIVVIKFTDPRILLTPARCSAKMPISTDLPG